MRYLIILFPFLLIAEIIKYENIKPFYYENQSVNFNIKIILPQPKKLTITPSYNVETNLTKINPYIYNLNVKFFATNESHKIILIAKKFYKEIDLNKLITIKNILPPPKNYSYIVTNNLKVINPIAAKYDKNNILLNFNIKCNNCLLKDFNIPNYKQTLKLIKPNEASYNIILPINTKNFTFYYFNPDNSTFDKVTIPIILNQQTISTQTDINPEESKFFTPINILILILIAFSLLIFIVYQKIFLLIFPILFSLLIVIQFIPKGNIVLKKNTKIQILPTPQSTIIYITNHQTQAEVLNKKDGYIKVKIKNKIGWVKNEEINQ